MNFDQSSPICVLFQFLRFQTGFAPFNHQFRGVAGKTAVLQLDVDEDLNLGGFDAGTLELDGKGRGIGGNGAHLGHAEFGGQDVGLLIQDVDCVLHLEGGEQGGNYK